MRTFFSSCRINRHLDTIDFHSLQMPKPAFAVMTNDRFRPISTSMITPTSITTSETIIVHGVRRKSGLIRFFHPDQNQRDSLQRLNNKLAPVPFASNSFIALYTKEIIQGFLSLSKPLMGFALLVLFCRRITLIRILQYFDSKAVQQ